MHTQAKPWDALRGQQLGVAFRRQVSIGERYIADFVAPSLEAALVEQRLQAVVAAVVAAVEAARVG